MMTDTAEFDWLERAHSFDLAALAAIYDRYSPGLHAYAGRLLGEAELAEDCVSETFSRFLQALRSGKGPQGYLQAYLYRIAHNWISDYYRRRPLPPLSLDEEPESGPDGWASVEQRAGALTAPQPELLELAAQRQEQARLRAALLRLTPEQRQVILLKYLEGWENAEVAASLGKPVGAVKALHHRAINALKRMLAEQPAEAFQEAAKR
jgi:RNA polymerase sigma-70 factor (ECF subfamily)